MPIADGAYTAPISLETREHATERVGTQRDEDPMGARVSAIAGDRAGSLGMGFRGLAVKGSGVRIPSAPPERQTLKPLLRQGFQRVRVAYRPSPGGSFRSRVCEESARVRRKMASSRSAAASSSPSKRCPYVSRVTWIDVCPSRSWMTFGCSPWAMSMAACVCRRSWNLSG